MDRSSTKQVQLTLDYKYRGSDPGKIENQAEQLIFSYFLFHNNFNIISKQQSA